MHPRLCVDDWLVVSGLLIVVGLGFGGWASVEAVHEPACVVPVDPVGGDGLDVAEAGQWSAPKRRGCTRSCTARWWSRRVRLWTTVGWSNVDEGNNSCTSWAASTRNVAGVARPEPVSWGAGQGPTCPGNCFDVSWCDIWGPSTSRYACHAFPPAFAAVGSAGQGNGPICWGPSWSRVGADRP